MRCGRKSCRRVQRARGSTNLNAWYAYTFRVRSAAPQPPREDIDWMRPRVEFGSNLILVQYALKLKTCRVHQDAVVHDHERKAPQAVRQRQRDVERPRVALDVVVLVCDARARQVLPHAECQAAPVHPVDLNLALHILLSLPPVR